MQFVRELNQTFVPRHWRGPRSHPSPLARMRQIDNLICYRYTNEPKLKKPGLCGTGLYYREDPFIGIPGDKATVLGMGICFPCRSGHTYPRGYYEVPVMILAVWSSGLASRNKKPRNLLRGLCFIDIVIYLFNSRTCPASGIIPIGTKPFLCCYM
jgi:hypothetical protein